MHTSKDHKINDHGKNLAESHPEVNKRVFHSNSVDKVEQGVGYDHKGRLNLSHLDQEATLKLNDKNTTYYICGPERFMVELDERLRDKVLDASQMNMELFGTGGVAIH